jgi:cytochrome c oxidase subunit 2
MSTALPQAHASEAIAVAAERRWAIIVVAIIALLVLMMVVTGLHWAAMPPSRVETVDVKTLHLRGEFVESNLGTTLQSDGKVVVRLVGQQYSFVPQCIVVPEGLPARPQTPSTVLSLAAPTRIRC